MISKSIQRRTMLNMGMLFAAIAGVIFFSTPIFSSEDCTDINKEMTGIFSDVVYSEAAPFISHESGMSSKVIRSHYVRVDFNEIFKELKTKKRRADGKPPWAGKKLHLNLFDDVIFTVKVDKVVNNKSGSTTWIGKDIGNGNSSSMFTIKEEIMVGSFKKGNKNFVISYLGDGIHEIQERDHSKFEGCEEPSIQNSLEAVVIQNKENLSSAKVNTSIDVLTVYTATARSAAGGTTAMNNLIDQAISETNSGYSNSNVTITLNSVHKAEITYSESSFNWSTTMTRLVGTSDGYMDSVHTLRNTYCADVVVLIVNDGAWCGLANSIMASSSGAFCIVSRTCATGYYSYGHEIGHLQGARHDRYVDNTDYSPYTYNHGRTYPTGRWRTVMAYNNACSAQGVSCTRVNYWSNPSVNYSGVATGISGGAGVGADNHLCLNNTAATVAAFKSNCGGGTPTYCSASATSQSYEWIARVQVGGIDKSSGASSYSDYTTTSTNITRSNSVSFTLTPGFSGSSAEEEWNIYIDYNNDGDFTDSGEFIYGGIGFGSVSGSFTVPSTATTGNTRMRVIMEFYENIGGPCRTFTYGEVEDYTVNIQ
jgi:GEVED domain/Metallo-peptidase family M12